MSNFSPQHQKLLQQAAAVEARETLIARNKEAARMHLLRIQQLLAQKPLRSR
jgi:hypothetical protein